jgi:hypothetical protein
MQDVELVDGPLDDAAAAGGEAAQRPARRRRWWLVPAAAAVVVLALVAYQGVTDARQRAALAALADVPGVLEPIDPDLPIRWELNGPTTEAVSYGVMADGASTNLVIDPDGSQRVVAVDLGSGAERWSVPVLGPNAPLAAARADGNGTSSGYCMPVGADREEPTSIACVVSDGFQTYGEDYVEVPATQSFVRVLDVHDGHTIAQWPAEHAGIGVSEGRVVVARWAGDDAIEVSAYEPPSDDPVWTRQLEIPTVATYRDDRPSIQGVGGAVEVSTGSWSARLDENGEPLAQQPRRDDTGGTWLVQAPNSDRLVSVSYSNDGTTSTQLLKPDGSVEHVLSGDLVYTSVDDGSVPNLLLTMPSPSSDGGVGGGDEEVPLGGLRGSDVRTGRTLWTADISTSGYGALVLLGRVYVLAGLGIDVLDGRTGKVLWTIEAPKGLTYGTIMTDGRHLLAVRNPSEVGASWIDAFDLTGADLAWSAVVPAGLSEVRPMGKVLFGVAYAESEYSSTVARVARFG